MQLSTTPHNDFFLQIMTRKEMARKFFNRFLPADIRKSADLNNLELVEGKHVSDDGVTLYNDLLYRLLLNNDQLAYLYLMAEHQRDPYKHMHLRLLGYDVGTKDDCAKQGYTYMPIVVHFVFYNGTSPWPYSTAFTDYYADPELGAKYLYMAPFILIDVPSYLPADIQQDTELGFCFAAFKATTTPDPCQTFEKFMQVANFEQHVRGLPADLKNIVTRYLAHFVDHTQHKLEDVAHLVSTNQQEEEKIMTSIVQALEQQYTQQGIQQGVQQGIQTVAKNMLIGGASVKQVSQWTGLSSAVVRRLA